MADLKFIITAINKAGDELKNLQKDVEGVGDKSKVAAKGTEDFNLKTVLTIGAATAAATAVYKIDKALVETVNDWSAYNIEMDKGSTATGMAVDEYSRLIQAADDARVSQESMTTALQMATKNGYPMTIESLGTIADKLKGIEDPSEKAKLATEIFGRQWADIMPFLDKGSAGIKELTDNVDKNMIATEDSIKASQEYATQVDNMQDAWTGFKNELGSNIMPVLTDVLTSLVDQITQIKTLKENMDILKSAEEAGVISKTDLSNAALAANWSTEAGVYATAKLVEKVEAASAANKNLSADVESVRFSQDKTNTSTDALAAAQAELAVQAAETAKKFIEQKNAVTSLDKNFGGIIGLAKQFDKGLEEIVAQEKIMKNNPIGSEKYEEAKGKVDELKQSMQDLANQVVLDMYQTTVAIGGITEAEAESYFQMAEDMGVISKEAADKATRVYGDAIRKINGMKIDPKTGNVNLEVDDSEIKGYRPPPMNSTVYLQPDPSEIAAWLKEDHFMTVRLIKSGESEFAAGGAVEGNSIITVGERGPELFVPASNGFIINHSEALAALSAARDNSGGGSGATGNGSMTNVTNNYNLTMPTSSNPADVKMAFELMEAWA